MSDSWTDGEHEDETLSPGEQRLQLALCASILLVVVSFLAMLSGCCAPQPARLDEKKVAAYLDAVATVVSFQEEFAPDELRSDAVKRGEEVNAAGRKLLAR